MLNKIATFDFADFTLNAFGNFCVALALSIVFANLEWDILFAAAAFNVLAFFGLGVIGATIWIVKHVRISIRIV